MPRARVWPADARRAYYAAWLARQVVPAQVCVVCGRVFTPAVRNWLRYKATPAHRWCCSRRCCGRLGGAALWALGGPVWRGE